MGTQGYVLLAKAQMRIGADAWPTLQLALKQADNIFQEGERDPGGYGRVTQLLAWEDVFKVQLRGHYFDDARITLQRLDALQDDESVLAWKSQMLAKMARCKFFQQLSG